MLLMFKIRFWINVLRAYSDVPQLTNVMVRPINITLSQVHFSITITSLLAANQYIYIYKRIGQERS